MTKVLLGLVILAGAASTACATVTAKATPDRPTLEVPAPPAKVIETTPMPEPLPPVPDLPSAPPATTRPPKPTSREPARTDPKPEPAATSEAAPPPVAPVTPPPQLRPGGTPEASEAAKQAQNAIDRAKQALGSVNSKQFAEPRRTIYTNAQLMLTQAEEARNKSDFENARKLAEKVEQTAKELQGK